VHKEIYSKFRNIEDSKWINMVFQSVDSELIEGVKFPGFPDDNIQLRMIGSYGKGALYEPKMMYQEIRRIAVKCKMQFDEKTILLDFACGYGRNVRFFMKDIFPGNLFGSDVCPDFVEICRNTFASTDNYNEILFSVNNPFPPLSFDDKSINIIMAYSLFSHLSEDVSLAWLKEFYRILKQDGLLFLTLCQQNFLNLSKNLLLANNHDANNHDINDYEKLIAKQFGDTSIQERYNNGEYIFYPSGGGGVLTSDFYGNTVIPDKYIYNKWAGSFDIIEHYDDPSKLPQAFICLSLLCPR